MMKNQIKKVLTKLKQDAELDMKDSLESGCGEGDGLEDVYPYLQSIVKIANLTDNKKSDRIYKVLKGFNDEAFFHLYECMWDQFDDTFIEKAANKIEKILVD
jgi:hypothetical protein